MDAYNVKVYHYPDGDQIRVYRSAVVSGNTYIDDVPFVSDEIETDSFSSDMDDSGFYDGSLCSENPFLFEREKVSGERSLYTSANRSKNMIYYLARSNVWDYFITFTFNPEIVDSFDYDECVRVISKWFNNLRTRVCPDIVYLFVPERHKSGRWHFHGLVSNCPELHMVDSGVRTVGGKIIYNVGQYRYGWSTATLIEDNSKVVHYIAKYVTKDVVKHSFGRKRYFASRNINRVEPDTFLVGDVDVLVEQLSDDACYISRSGHKNESDEVLYFEIPTDSQKTDFRK